MSSGSNYKRFRLWIVPLRNSIRAVDIRNKTHPLPHADSPAVHRLEQLVIVKPMPRANPANGKGVSACACAYARESMGSCSHQRT